MSHVEVHHDDSAIGRNQLQYVIWNIPWMIGQRSRIAVREENWCPCHLEGSAHRFGRNVAEIDEHADPVHLIDYGSAKLVDPVVLGIVGCTVGKLVILEMRQRHVTRTKIIELPQRREAAANLVSAFNADKRSNPAGLVNANDVIGGAGELEVIGISAHHALDGVDL